MRIFIIWLWTTIPYGELLIFNYGELRITLHKNFWLTIEENGYMDLIPLARASPEIIEIVEDRLV